MDRICKSGSLQGFTELPEDLRRTFVTAMDISAVRPPPLHLAFLIV
jgi:ribonucleotide reductase alpha subunit